MPRFDVDASLTDPWAATLGAEAHAPLSILELDVHRFYSAAFGERFPAGLEVLALETAAADLLCEQPVFQRMVECSRKWP